MFFWCIVIGFFAGLVGYLAGLASLVSYPALLALGVPPVLANTSNTVGLLPSGLGSVAKMGKELAKLRYYPLTPQLIVAALAGLFGGWLLVSFDSAVFEKVVPYLVLLGTLAVAFQPKINAYAAKRGGKVRLPLPVFLAIFALIGIYSGYFGAGSGVLFVAMYSLATPASVSESVMMKAPMIFACDLIVTIYFIASGHVVWAAAAGIAIGSFLGGYVGPIIQSYIPERGMRIIVVLGGLAMTAWLLVQAMDVTP